MNAVTTSWVAKWKTDTDPDLECQIHREADKVIARLFNTKIQSAEGSAFITYGQGQVLGQLKECVQFSRAGNCEWRVFRCLEPKILVVIMVKFSLIKEVQAFNMEANEAAEECYKEYIPSFRQGIGVDGTIEFDVPFKEKNPGDAKLNTKTSDAGVTYYDFYGSEREVVRICSDQGLEAQETVYIFRKKIGEREILEAELRSKRGTVLGELDLEEDSDSKTRTIEQRIRDIKTGQPRLIYSKSSHPRSIGFNGFSQPAVTFAGGLDKPLALLSLSKIQEFIIKKLTIKNGKMCYSAGNCTVKKELAPDAIGENKWTPTIHIRLARSIFISAPKTPYAFFEGLFGFTGAASYQSEVNEQHGMKSLLLYDDGGPSALTAASILRAQEDFQAAFARCATINIRIPYDRRTPSISMDDKTWVFFFGKAGISISEIFSASTSTSSSGVISSENSTPSSRTPSAVETSSSAVCLQEGTIS